MHNFIICKFHYFWSSGCLFTWNYSTRIWSFKWTLDF